MDTFLLNYQTKTYLSRFILTSLYKCSCTNMCVRVCVDLSKWASDCGKRCPLSGFPRIGFCVMLRMTNRLQASWTWTLRRHPQHKVVIVGISAPRSLAFDPKGCCSQQRMKDCIVQVYTDVTLVPSTPNHHVKEADTGRSSLDLCHRHT